MIRCQRCARRGNRNPDTDLVGQNHVHLPLHENRRLVSPDRILSLVQAIDNLALLKNRRFRRVQIFWPILIVLDQSPREPDDMAKGVTDGKHDPVPKPFWVAGTVELSRLKTLLCKPRG